MNLMSILANFGSIKEKAPQMMSEFLDSLLEENRPHLRPSEGEVQICYLMTQNKRSNKPEYTIAIVALSEDNKILRVIKAIPLSDAISTILNTSPND